MPPTKNVSARASDLSKKLMPSNHCGVAMSRTSSVTDWSYDSLIKEKFVARKQLLKLKERVYMMKFMVFLRLWREDMRLLSIRKSRTKSQKRLDSSFQTLCGSSQKHRSGIILASFLLTIGGCCPCIDDIWSEDKDKIDVHDISIQRLCTQPMAEMVYQLIVFDEKDENKVEQFNSSEYPHCFQLVDKMRNV